MLEAFDTLFNKRYYEAAVPSWSEHSIQHSAHIEPGCGGLFTDQELAGDEPGTIVAEGDFP